MAITFFASSKAYAGTLSCAVRTSACNAGEVAIFKLYDVINSHAELSNQSNYSNLVCCGGVTGISNSCLGTYAVVAKLSSATNAHIEQNNQANYSGSDACISVPAGGNVSVGYQSTDCTGFDTTVASMTAATNAHAGNGAAYTTKICATASGSGSVAVDIVDSGGISVASPSVSFAASNFWWGSQQPTGILGSSSQKMRITNTGMPNWTLSVAATSGPTALWQSGSSSYDFNGLAAAGRLQVDASVAAITSQSGCTTTGLSKGVASYFAQGIQDSVTLLSGSSAQTNCYWDLTGVNMIQDVPAAQATGNYSLGMTLTAA